jgi:hypothetical protein
VRGHRVRVGAVRAAGVAVLVLALGACAGPERVGEVTAVALAPDGAVVATVATPASAPAAYVLGVDATIAGRRDEAAAGAAGAPRPVTRACAGDACYSVVAGRLAVRAGEGAAVRDVWQVSGAEYERLAAAYPDLGDPARHLASTSVVVVPAPGGHAVFVANGRDGVLRRDADGRWTRLGVPRGADAFYFAAPPRLGGAPSDLAWPVATAAGGAVLLAVGVGLLVRRRVRPARAAAGLGVALVVGALAGLATGMPEMAVAGGPVYRVLIVLAVTVGGVAVGIMVVTDRG